MRISEKSWINFKTNTHTKKILDSEDKLVAIVHGFTLREAELRAERMLKGLKMKHK